MAKPQGIHIVRHFPETVLGMQKLRKRVAIVHAQAVLNSIRKLSIPTFQKAKLLDAIIADQKAALKQPKKARNLER